MKNQVLKLIGEFKEKVQADQLEDAAGIWDELDSAFATLCGEDEDDYEDDDDGDDDDGEEDDDE